MKGVLKMYYTDFACIYIDYLTAYAVCLCAVVRLFVGRAGDVSPR